MIRGEELTIKPLEAGDNLKQFKDTYDKRRIFFRIRSFKYVNPDLNQIFSPFGNIEKINLVKDSEMIKKNHYSKIGFVLFETESFAQLLVQQKEINMPEFTIIIETIKPKKEAKKKIVQKKEIEASIPAEKSSKIDKRNQKMYLNQENEG